MTALIQTQTTGSLKDLSGLLKRQLDQKPVAAPEKPSKPQNVVPLTQEARDAISALSGLLEAVELPSERRALTLTEQIDLLALGSTAKKVEAAVKKAVAAVKQAVFFDFDVALEEDQDPEQLPLDGEEKHYLVKQEKVVGDTGQRFTRELAEGAPVVAAIDLHELWQQGKISRADYYQATRKPDLPRETDEEGLLELLNKKPNLLPVIGDVVQPGKVTASFHIRTVTGG